MAATQPVATTSREPTGKSTSMQKKVLVGGSIGQFVEFYDFTLYGLSAVILSEYFFPDGDKVTGLLVIFATFGVAFVMRPLGGLFFGALGDKVGRRKTLTVTIFLVGICTALIGILPGFDQIGWFAPILLILARLGQGFSAGGESVGGPSFVYEHAPVGKRGLWINITLAATALPSVFAGGLILLLSTVMSDASFDSWGWRIPFLLALPLSAVGLWIRSRTDESDLFKKTAAERPKEFSPIRDSFRENSVGMLQVFFVLGLTALGFYMLSAYFVTYIQTTGDLTREQSLLTNAIAMASYTIFLPIAGAIGDRVGRNPCSSPAPSSWPSHRSPHSAWSPAATWAWRSSDRRSSSSPCAATAEAATPSSVSASPRRPVSPRQRSATTSPTPSSAEPLRSSAPGSSTSPASTPHQGST